MASYEDARRAFEELWREKQDLMLVRRAKTGRGTGEDVDVDGKPGWIWVRYDSDQSKISQVFSWIRNLPEDVPVIVGKPWPGAEHEEVIGINTVLYYQGLTELVLDQYTNPAHGDSHGETGSDRAPIGLRNLEPGRARETSPVSISVYVEQFRYTYGNTVVHWAGASIDLTASVPAGVGHRYVLVSLNIETNALLATNGDVVPLAMPPTIVAIPAGHIPIAYVDLAQGETTIEDALIYDARLLWHAVGGVSDHTHSEAGDGGASLMCLEEIYVEDLPVVTDGSAITPYAFYHTVYVVGMYTDGRSDITWIYPDEAYAGDCPQWIVLRPGPFGLYDTYEITIRHGVGNIFLSGKQDLVLNEQTDLLMLFYNGTYWCDVISTHNELPKAFGCRAWRSNAQNIPDVVWTALEFDRQDYDTDDCFAPTSTRLYGGRAGYYSASGALEFAATQNRRLAIRKNGIKWLARNDVNAGTATTVSTMFFFLDGVNDYVEIMVYQNSGGAVNTNSTGDDVNNSERCSGALAFIGG